MPKSYPPVLRRQVCVRLRSGERVTEIAAETGISEATLFKANPTISERISGAEH
ncbi:hypothetical protein [Nocardia beijingensis]|uniref:hypothetical protein n=1 Tax=Nocardia beijingensis TaxID=95162 RepID=UPI0033A3DA3B